MTTAIGASTTPPPSPAQRLDSQLRKDVGAGKVSYADATAISASISAIDKSLNAKPATTTTAKGASKAATEPTPADLNTRIAGLIDDQITSGALTSQEGTELKAVFKAAFTTATATPKTAAPKATPAKHHGTTYSGSDSTFLDPFVSFDQAAQSAGPVSAASNRASNFLQSVQSSDGSSYGADGSSSDSGGSPLFADFSA